MLFNSIINKVFSGHCFDEKETQMTIQNQSLITPVILCGGSGTRLWPLSRKSFPKQFVPLIDNESLLSLTAKRLQIFSNSLILVGAEEHRFLIQEALSGLKTQNELILEPFPRNTTAAMTMAASATRYRHVWCSTPLPKHCLWLYRI